MATIKDILYEERNRNPKQLVLFLEGKFWKAYEHSAYELVKRYNFKPSKRHIKSIDEEVVSVGFPEDACQKYLGDNVTYEANNRCCRVWVQSVGDEVVFQEWKHGIEIKQPIKPLRKIPMSLSVQADNRRAQENLPVFKMVYDLLLRLFHDCQKTSKDYRYTLGEDIKKRILQVEVDIYHANEEIDTKTKLGYIQDALDKMLEVKLCVRILHDSHQFSLKQFALLSEQMVNVEQQLLNWKHYNKQKLQT